MIQPVVRQSRRPGFMMLEAIVGLVLLAALAVSLAAAAGLRQRTAQRLADQHATLVAAQEALANLQSSGQATTTDPLAQISVSSTGTRVGDLEWVELTVVRENRHVLLVGLARTDRTRSAATQPGGAR